MNRQTERSNLPAGRSSRGTAVLVVAPRGTRLAGDARTSALQGLLILQQSRSWNVPPPWHLCIWRGIYFRIFFRFFLGFFFASGFLASWLLGFLASWLLGFLASWLLGFSASRLLGFLAFRLLGFLAFRLPGFLASRLLGFWASWLLGFLASWLLGFLASWLFGFSASWLLGFWASRFFARLCGFWWLFGFSHPLHSQFLFGRWRFSDIMGGAAAPPNPPATF